jgi:RNA polymerase sigma-70 factor (ECF subfamily)
MRQGILSLPVHLFPAGGESPSAMSDRSRALLDEHFVFIWRLLRRLGVAENDVDDAVQRVFIVASGKLATIAPASERSFLFGTALRVAASYRRASRKQKVVDEGAITALADPGLMPDEILARNQAIALFDQILQSMPDDLRIVFVLSDIEEMTAAEVAAMQGIPPGTVASRLRRARKEFHDRTQKVLISARGRR